MSAVYSPTEDSAKPMGMNAAPVVNEETSNGVRNSAPASIAACTAGIPPSLLSKMVSTITIALSTNRPSAMIKAASEIWLTVIPIICMTKNVMIIELGINVATTNPVRSPRKAIITSKTTPMACNRLLLKSAIFLVTSSA